MVSVVAAVLAAVPLYWVFSLYTSLQKNITAAKLSELPYIVTPIHIYSPIWLITHRLFLPLLHKLPTAWTEQWIDLVTPDWPWYKLYGPFAKYGDTFLTVSPTGVLVWTAAPEAIRQITQRREAFPKPLETYKILDIYGKNILSTEGSDWKKYRKVTSPGFNEKNNILVFRESVAQAQGMLRKWLGSDGKGNHTLVEVPTDAMRTTLHVISKIGFGVGLLWPGEQPSEEDKRAGLNYGSHEPTEGFTMSFEHALCSLLDNLTLVLLIPRWLLKYLPIAGAKEAREAYMNWGQYMKAIYDQKVMEVRTGQHTEGMDFMGSLVRSTMTDENTTRGMKDSTGVTEKGQVGQPVLPQADILGNAFVLIIAGHETTANSLHFALMMLAMTPGSQRRLQKEIENIFGNTSPNDWDYDCCINKCLGGMIGAVLNEQLRLMQPVTSIPKSVRRDQDQAITIEGKKHVLPRGAFINIVAASVHRSPKYWQSCGPSKISGRPNDLDDFVPERWLVNEGTRSGIDASEQSDSDGEEDFGGFTGRDTAAELFRPVRGSYLPFSDGPRSCLGRRLAQVKVVAVLAVIFQNHSIELAVDEWATDKEVEKMGKQERIELYKRTRQKAEKTLRSATSRITLKLHEGETYIPVRIVRKGEERFLNLIE